MAKVPRYSREDVARRGDEIYEREVLPGLGPEDEGKLVLIDVVTGAYEMDGDEIAASDRLLTRHPDAQVWMRQAGSRYARRLRSRQSAVEEHAPLDEAVLVFAADQVFLDLDCCEE